MIPFLEQKKDNWQRLEDLLEMLAGPKGLRGLTKMEVREFGELYRRAAADLAIARAETRDQRLINYLNSLVIRAHGRIYRAESQGAGLVWKFFAEDLPQTFRRNWIYFALAFGAFVAFAIFGFASTWYNTDFTHFVMLSGITEEISANHQWWKSLNESNQIGASFIMSNNILVSIRGFALGALFGIGAFYEISFFGAHVGSIFAACYKINPAFGNELAYFVVGHGVIEISCVMFCSAAGMMIGYAMINPGNMTRGQALKKKGMEAAKIVIGSACFLVVAGTIEGFLSPSDLPPFIKIATGLGTGIAMYSYLLFAGQKAGSENVAAANVS